MRDTPLTQGISLFFDIYPFRILIALVGIVHQYTNHSISTLGSCPIQIQRNNAAFHLFNEPRQFFQVLSMKKFTCGTLKKFHQKNFENPCKQVYRCYAFMLIM